MNTLINDYIVNGTVVNDKSIQVKETDIDKKVGYLKIIIGPMYAGKSTELIRHIRQYKFLKKNVISINHKINKRYGSDKIITHDKEEVNDCINLEKLSDLLLISDVFERSDVIIIDELQFFKDAFKTVVDFVEKYNKIVICAGLLGDYKRRLFGDIYKLLPYADDIKHIKALCSISKDGTEAPFTKRIINNKEQNLVGSNEAYISVSRKHFLS